MGTSGSLSWLLPRGPMLHTGKTRKEEFRERRGAVVVLVYKSVSACIQIEALPVSISRLSTFESMAEHLHTAGYETIEAKQQL